MNKKRNCLAAFLAVSMMANNATLGCAEPPAANRDPLHIDNTLKSMKKDGWDVTYLENVYETLRVLPPLEDEENLSEYVSRAVDLHGNVTMSSTIVEVPDEAYLGYAGYNATKVKVCNDLADMVVPKTKDDAVPYKKWLLRVLPGARVGWTKNMGLTLHLQNCDEPIPCDAVFPPPVTEMLKSKLAVDRHLTPDEVITILTALAASSGAVYKLIAAIRAGGFAAAPEKREGDVAEESHKIEEHQQEVNKEHEQEVKKEVKKEDEQEDEQEDDSDSDDSDDSDSDSDDDNDNDNDNDDDDDDDDNPDLGPDGGAASASTSSANGSTDGQGLGDDYYDSQLAGETWVEDNFELRAEAMALLCRVVTRLERLKEKADELEIDVSEATKVLEEALKLTRSTSKVARKTSAEHATKANKWCDKLAEEIDETMKKSASSASTSDADSLTDGQGNDSIGDQYSSSSSSAVSAPTTSTVTATHTEPSADSAQTSPRLKATTPNANSLTADQRGSTVVPPSSSSSSLDGTVIATDTEPSAASASTGSATWKATDFGNCDEARNKLVDVVEHLDRLLFEASQCGVSVIESKTFLEAEKALGKAKKLLSETEHKKANCKPRKIYVGHANSVNKACDDLKAAIKATEKRPTAPTPALRVRANSKRSTNGKGSGTGGDNLSDKKQTPKNKKTNKVVVKAQPTPAPVDKARPALALDPPPPPEEKTELDGKISELQDLIALAVGYDVDVRAARAALVAAEKIAASATIKEANEYKKQTAALTEVSKKLVPLVRAQQELAADAKTELDDAIVRLRGLIDDARHNDVDPIIVAAAGDVLAKATKVADSATNAKRYEAQISAVNKACEELEKAIAAKRQSSTTSKGSGSDGKGGGHDNGSGGGSGSGSGSASGSGSGSVTGSGSSNNGSNNSSGQTSPDGSQKSKKKKKKKKNTASNSAQGIASDNVLGTHSLDPHKPKVRPCPQLSLNKPCQGVAQQATDKLNTEFERLLDKIADAEQNEVDVAETKKVLDNKLNTVEFCSAAVGLQELTNDVIAECNNLEADILKNNQERVRTAIERLLDMIADAMQNGVDVAEAKEVLYKALQAYEFCSAAADFQKLTNDVIAACNNLEADILKNNQERVRTAIARLLDMIADARGAGVDVAEAEQVLYKALQADEFCVAAADFQDLANDVNAACNNLEEAILKNHQEPVLVGKINVNNKLSVLNERKEEPKSRMFARGVMPIITRFVSLGR